MVRKCEPRIAPRYCPINSETFRIAVDWVGGSIKGIKLDPKQWEIEWWCRFSQSEVRAKYDDVIVQLSPGYFIVLTRAAFRAAFRDADDIPF